MNYHGTTSNAPGGQRRRKLTQSAATKTTAETEETTSTTRKSTFSSAFEPSNFGDRRLVQKVHDVETRLDERLTRLENLLLEVLVPEEEQSTTGGISNMFKRVVSMGGRGGASDGVAEGSTEAQTPASPVTN